MEKDIKIIFQILVLGFPHRSYFGLLAISSTWMNQLDTMVYEWPNPTWYIFALDDSSCAPTNKPTVEAQVRVAYDEYEVQLSQSVSK